jgi:hypothetical protein
VPLLLQVHLQFRVQHLLHCLLQSVSLTGLEAVLSLWQWLHLLLLTDLLVLLKLRALSAAQLQKLFKRLRLKVVFSAGLALWHALD